MKAILVRGIAPSLIDSSAGECIVVESYRMGQDGRTVDIVLVKRVGKCLSDRE